MKVKPVPGLKVRDPQTKEFLPAEGAEVEDFDFYYTRRLRDGDVVLVTETTQTKAKGAE